MRFGRAKHGIHTMSVTDTQRRIADLEKTLDAGIQKHTEAGGAAGNATAPTTMTRIRHPGAGGFVIAAQAGASIQTRTLIAHSELSTSSGDDSFPEVSSGSGTNLGAALIVIFDAAIAARSRASETSSAVAMISPMRRPGYAEGLPNRRTSVSATCRASSTPE